VNLINIKKLFPMREVITKRLLKILSYSFQYWGWYRAVLGRN